MCLLARTRGLGYSVFRVPDSATPASPACLRVHPLLLPLSARAMRVSSGKAASDVQQACMRPCTADGLPMIGQVPGVPHAFIATGHNCWGILWGPATVCVGD